MATAINSNLNLRIPKRTNTRIEQNFNVLRAIVIFYVKS